MGGNLDYNYVTFEPILYASNMIKYINTYEMNIYLCVYWYVKKFICVYDCTYVCFIVCACLIKRKLVNDNTGHMADYTLLMWDMTTVQCM